jgi:hypothetical protein
MAGMLSINVATPRTLVGDIVAEDSGLSLAATIFWELEFPLFGPHIATTRAVTMNTKAWRKDFITSSLWKATPHGLAVTPWPPYQNSLWRNSSNLVANVLPLLLL